MTEELCEDARSRALGSGHRPMREVPSRSVSMRTGGDDLSASVHCTYSSDVHDGAGDVGEYPGASRRRNVFSASGSVFQIAAVALSTRLKRLAAAVRRRTAAKSDSTGFDVRRCFQCLRAN